jgi:anti-anti-sigma factor
VAVDSGLPGRYGTIEVHRDADETVLRLAGEIDSAVVAAYEREHGDQPVPIDAVDAGAVTFIASRGVALLLRCVEASARAPVLRRSSPQLERLLQLAGLTEVFHRPPDT